MWKRSRQGNIEQFAFRLLSPFVQLPVYTVPDGFAGSILNLKPGTEYECRFR